MILPGRPQGGIAGHEGGAAGVGPHIPGADVGIVVDDIHVLDAQPQFFGHDLGDDRLGALADLAWPR